jgi:aspartate ammonia-lyase
VTSHEPLPDRIETDSLGPLSVPACALYGVQTQRAIGNFPVSGNLVGGLRDLVKALAMVKSATALANHGLGRLEPEKTQAIQAACAEIAAGHHDAHFVVDVFQGGAGTSTNMNMNEVIANRGLELLGRPRGAYQYLHPQDDVNMSQSTNDVYPTALRLSLSLTAPRLGAALTRLARAFQERGLAFQSILKVGRTQLQDAVPMTLGQEFTAFAITIREDTLRLEESLTLLREVNLGGTAIGTGLLAPEGFHESALFELERLSGIKLVPAFNLIEAGWDTGVFVFFSGVLKRIAVKLSKIANDLRLLSSGPHGGLGEIRLPAVQPGSSIMPGKINPVIPEMVNQVAFSAIGADLTVTMAAEAGQLQLNAFEPVIAFTLLQTIKHLANAADTFAVRCVSGIEANVANCKRNLEAGTALATALVPSIGYARAAEIVKIALASGRSLRDLLIEGGDLSISAIDSMLDIERAIQR